MPEFSAKSLVLAQASLHQIRSDRLQSLSPSTQACWKAGKSLSELSQLNTKTASHILKKLTADAKLPTQFLKALRGFYDCYSHRSPWKTNLTWEHYEILIRIKNKDERSFYQDESVRHGWSVQNLKRAIQNQTFSLSGGVGAAGFSVDVGRHGKAVGCLHNTLQNDVRAGRSSLHA